MLKADYSISRLRVVIRGHLKSLLVWFGLLSNPASPNLLVAIIGGTLRVIYIQISRVESLRVRHLVMA